MLVCTMCICQLYRKTKYNFLLVERLFNPNESGFDPFDSCVNQLLAITY